MMVPDACTLPTVQQPARLAEFDALFAEVVRGSRIARTHLRLWLPGRVGLRAQVEDLAARETACCGFFTFTVSEPSAGTLIFDIEVPPGHVDVLDAMAGRVGEMR